MTIIQPSLRKGGSTEKVSVRKDETTELEIRLEKSMDCVPREERGGRRFRFVESAKHLTEAILASADLLLLENSNETSCTGYCVVGGAGRLLG